MEQSLRNILYNTVVQCRQLLEHDLALQLEGTYGVHVDGTAEPIEHLKHLDAVGRADWQAIDAALQHEEAGGATRKEAVERFLRESAFTLLNRLAALKLMEHPSRALIQPSVGAGDQSKGFQQFSLISPEATRAHPDGGYRLYLELLFDDMGQTLGVLFDRTLPSSILFPWQPCLKQVLALLNDPGLEAVWAEDETLGWIYQYFTPTELREEVRKASSAPRNSYELAIRNQFYTPDYVVAFLADNTLGRLWYEMRQGQTELVEKCRYLIRRPIEVFLDPPDQFLPRECRDWVRQVRSGDFSNLPDDPTELELGSVSLAFNGYEVAERLGGYGDLLAWAGEKLERFDETGELPTSSLDRWLILFALQRDWRIITGSAPAGDDFLELWHRIYLSWRDAMQAETSAQVPGDPVKRAVYIAHRPPRDPRELGILDPACGSGHFLLYCFDLLRTIYDEAYEDPDLGPALQADYPDRTQFHQAVPKLILEHNLFGIDIDPRACQIAAFALWLRAQRAWAEMGLKMRERARVDHTHIVCAEPMPGEYDLLGEFVRDLRPAVLGNMLREVWDKMKLAGEAGSLLKIEQEIGELVRKAREALASLPPGVQLTLFGPEEPQQLALRLDPRDLHDEVFWDEAESRVVEALRAYARRTTGEQQVSRRLFADDAIQGMAFIDLLQKPFDVVLMNPPFGAASLGSKAYIQKAYPRTKNDLYAAFVERGLELLRPGGYLGAITSRTGFFLTSFQRWREEILLKEAQLVALADLGYGVLDTAMVETAAYVLRKIE